MSDSKHVTVSDSQIFHIPTRSEQRTRRAFTEFFGHLNQPFRPSAPTFSNDFSGRRKRLLPESKFQPTAKRVRLRSPQFFPFVPDVFSSSSALRVRAGMSRRPFKRRKRKRGSMPIAKLALSKVRRLERKIEQKSFDILQTTIGAVGSAGDIRNLALIIQGDSRNHRDGNAISPFFLSMRYHWLGTTADNTGVFRTIIFRDMRQVLGAIPVVLDILTEATPLSQWNYSFRGRFKILYDRTWTQSNDTAIRTNYNDVIRIRLTRKMTWNSGVSTALVSNGLFMINITNLPANEPSFTFTSRLHYNDN